MGLMLSQYYQQNASRLYCYDLSCVLSALTDRYGDMDRNVRMTIQLIM